MLDIKLDEHTIEDNKLVHELRRLGVSEEILIEAYETTQAKKNSWPSGDLISRSALLRALWYTASLHIYGEQRALIDIHGLIEYVEKMPTAFDVDKVVEQLEEMQKSQYPDGRPRFTASERRTLEIAITVLNKAKEPKQ